MNSCLEMLKTVASASCISGMPPLSPWSLYKKEAAAMQCLGEEGSYVAA